MKNFHYETRTLKERVYKLKYERLPFRVKDLEISGHDVIALGLEGAAGNM